MLIQIFTIVTKRKIHSMAEEGENKVEQKVTAAPKTVDFMFRMTILVLLAVQNAAHALMSRYSKVVLSIVLSAIST